MNNNPMSVVKKFLWPFLLAPFACAGEIPYPYLPVESTKPSAADFWHPRIETNRKVTVWHDLDECEKTGRLDNFRVAAGEKGGFYEGLRFNDSDVHKVVEGAARILGQGEDPKLEAALDELIATMAKAQEKDGYLYTVMQLAHDQPVKGVVAGERWLHERESHETYCMGHLIEAGAVHFEQTGKRNLLDIAVKAADCIDRSFGPGKLELPSGHQEIEIALAKLAEVTGEKRYADLAHWFLEQRGRISDDRKGNWGPYFQDHQPVAEQNEAVGHAVRAAYQYMAMADIATLKDLQPYRDALHAIWENVAGRKLYLTVGIGGGNGEGFSGEYDLPNLGAYNETCSSIANILWQQRMFQLEGDAKYVEILERCLYNSFLSGVSMEGNTFFYPNKLTSADGATRTPWFACACCPPNVVRFIPQIPSFAYATHGDTIHVNLYGSNSTGIPIGGETVELTQVSNYPWDGRVEITVGTEAEFTLALRVPGWLKTPFPSDLYRYTGGTDAEPTLTLNGGSLSANADGKGYVRLARKWNAGDKIVFDLPMPVRRVTADEKVESCHNRVALMRGPIVYAAEGPDNDGRVHSLLVPADAEFRALEQPDLLGGVTVLRGGIESLSWREPGAEPESTPHELTAIPYYAWAHRGREPMRVWLATTPAAAWPETPAAETSARIRTSGHLRWSNPGSVSDGLLPQSSTDPETPRFLWDDTSAKPIGAGTLEGGTHRGRNSRKVRWIQYDFLETREIDSCSFYWSTTNDGRAPASFRILYQKDGKWKPVGAELPEPVGNQLQTVRFPGVNTNAVRLEVTPRGRATTGLYEWIVR